MKNIFRKVESIMSDVVDPETPVSSVTKLEAPITQSFGDDVNIPNIVRGAGPRHRDRLLARKETLMKEVAKIDVEVGELDRLLNALSETK